MGYSVKISFTDTETTGLIPRDEHIIQLAMIKVEHNPNNPLEIRIIEELEQKWELPEGVEVPDEVAAINGYKEEVWEKEAIPRKKALKAYLKAIEWTGFGGQNPSFDYRHLDEEIFRQNLEWPKLSSYRLWSVEMLAVPLNLLGYIPNVKQETMAEFFKLGEQTHDALDDVRQSVEIYRRLMWLQFRGLTDSHVQDAVDLKTD